MHKQTATGRSHGWHLCAHISQRWDQMRWWDRCKSMCSAKHPFFFLSLGFFFFHSKFSALSRRKSEKIKVKKPEHVMLGENKFTHACSLQPTDNLEECSLVGVGYIRPLTTLLRSMGVFLLCPSSVPTLLLLPLSHRLLKTMWEVMGRWVLKLWVTSKSTLSGFE